MKTETTPQKYTALFSSELGKEVLSHLNKSVNAGGVNIEYGALAHQEGQRHVLRYIETMIKKGQKDDRK